MSRYITDELDNVGQVVLVPGVVLARVGFEEVVAGGKLEGHTRGRPNVGGGSVPRTQQDLQTAVLPRLDILSEVVILSGQIQFSCPACLRHCYLPPNKRCPNRRF